jgi:hypothetical protein
MAEPIDAVTADDLALDGNAAAGELEAMFGADATMAEGTCAHCGTRQELGRLTAWTRGPGLVLRCSVCRGVALRIVRTPSAVHLDLHGVTRLVMPR